jgi:hypothetical protein
MRPGVLQEDYAKKVIDNEITKLIEKQDFINSLENMYESDNEGEEVSKFIGFMYNTNTQDERVPIAEEWFGNRRLQTRSKVII